MDTLDKVTLLLVVCLVVVALLFPLSANTQRTHDDTKRRDPPQ